MNNKVIGIILIIIGAALIMWGYDVYYAAASQLSRAFSGDTPIEAWAGIIGGGVCVLVGITKVK
jgi:uncharacterized membrane protein YidH (DUF202 family)